MRIEFQCPQCQAIGAVPDKLIGQEVACPKCFARITVPQPAAPDPATEAAAVAPPPKIETELDALLAIERRLGRIEVDGAETRHRLGCLLAFFLVTFALVALGLFTIDVTTY